MIKCIVIENCTQCPHRSHSGGFGHPRYKPTCSKAGQRLLPYKVPAGMDRACGTDVIPTWCPLQDYPQVQK